MRKRSEPAIETDETEADLVSRTDARRARLDAEENLLQLAETLVRQNAHVLSALELPEGLGDAVSSAQRTPGGAARNRALRLVRAALRDLDAAALRERLETVHGVAVPKAKLRKRDRPR